MKINKYDDFIQMCELSVGSYDWNKIQVAQFLHVNRVHVVKMIPVFPWHKDHSSDIRQSFWQLLNIHNRREPVIVGVMQINWRCDCGEIVLWWTQLTITLQIVEAIIKHSELSWTSILRVMHQLTSRWSSWKILKNFGKHWLVPQVAVIATEKKDRLSANVSENGFFLT